MTSGLPKKLTSAECLFWPHVHGKHFAVSCTLLKKETVEKTESFNFSNLCGLLRMMRQGYGLIFYKVLKRYLQLCARPSCLNTC